MRLDYASRQPTPVRPTRQIDGWLVALLLLGLGVRLAWAISLTPDESGLNRLPDQTQYLQLGRNLLHHQGLQFVDPRFNDAVWAFRSPGYPIFVALCGGNIRIIRIVQAAIDASMIVAVYWLARQWVPRGAALFSAALVAVNPFLIFFSGLVLSETLFAAMLVWAMVLLIIPARWGIFWVCGAILLALSIHVRPSALLLPIVLSLVAAFVNRERSLPYDRRWSPPVGALSLMLSILVLVPWAWRNNRVLGRWIWTTTNSGLSLYDGLNPDATGASDQTFVGTMPQLSWMDEVGRSEYLSDLAWQFVREHPVRAAELAVIKIGRMWSPIPLSREYGNRPTTMAIAALYMIPFFVLIILGLGYGSAPQAAKAYLLAPAVYFTIVHAISVGSLRYRIPADVPMAVAAGFAIDAVCRKRTRTAPLPVPERPNDQ